MEKKTGEDKVGTPSSNAKAETGKSSSTNRFSILESVEDKTEKVIAVSEATEDKIEEEVQMDQRKVRAAAAGVADLMKSLKTRKKDRSIRARLSRVR